MITYPLLNSGAVIGVTASSYGVAPGSRELFEEASRRMEESGYVVVCGDTVFKQAKAKSASGKERAAEFNDMMQDKSIDLIIPPWGGELLIEMLEHIDFSRVQEKWILGFSDISLLLLAITLQTGLATAHGPSLVDLRGKRTDYTTAMWQAVLSTPRGGSIAQHSSRSYQKKGYADDSSGNIVQLNEPTVWKTVDDPEVTLSGRLLGGCIDVIRHIVGTPFGNVQYFQENMIHHEPILWYLENCELSAVDLRRSLVQMKLAGWFDHCSGILFGRSSANRPVDDYTAEDCYQELSAELQVPVIYDVDFGHVPPQLTLINGAYAEVHVQNGAGSVTQVFRD